jgi:hydrogenase maturation protease
MSASRILVVGIGNPDRGDDGIGPAVARRLAGRLPGDVAVVTRTGDILSLIADWAEADALVCVDAALGEAPGRIHRLDLATDALPLDVALVSSHGFGLAEAVELARTLGQAPRRMIVYAVEGNCFEGGAAMTPEVAEAAGLVADRVATEIDRLRRETQETAHA